MKCKVSNFDHLDTNLLKNSDKPLGSTCYMASTIQGPQNKQKIKYGINALQHVV